MVSPLTLLSFSAVYYAVFFDDEMYFSVANISILNGLSCHLLYSAVYCAVFVDECVLELESIVALVAFCIFCFCFCFRCLFLFF